MSSTTETAAHYSNLTLTEKWDYCWDVDLAQEDWPARCLAELPVDSEYLIDLQCVLLDMHL